MGAGGEKGKEDKILNICLMFYFGGCFSAPLIARNYLSPLTDASYILNIAGIGTFDAVDLTEISKVDDLYYMVGGLAAAIFVVFVATYLVCGRKPKNQEESEEASNGENGIEDNETNTSGSEQSEETR